MYLLNDLDNSMFLLTLMLFKSSSFPFSYLVPINLSTFLKLLGSFSATSPSWSLKVGQDAGVVLQHILEDLGLEDSLGFFLGGWLGSLPQVLPGAELCVRHCPSHLGGWPWGLKRSVLESFERDLVSLAIYSYFLVLSDKFAGCNFSFE